MAFKKHWSQRVRPRPQSDENQSKGRKMQKIVTHITTKKPTEKKGRNVEDTRNNTSAEGQYMMTQEAADYLRLSARTLERMRVDGTGPRFLKAGPGLRARVLYRLDDLKDWLESFSYGSTSEYDGE